MTREQFTECEEFPVAVSASTFWCEERETSVTSVSMFRSMGPLDFWAPFRIFSCTILVGSVRLTMHA